MPRSLTALREQLNGLLAFVTTPFAENCEIAPTVLQAQIARLLHTWEQIPAALFVCCGAGELGALDLAEYRELVAAAVDAAAEALPVFAGVGYGTRIAEQFCRAAGAAGVDGVLVFPPYLADGPQAGLLAHYGAVADATDGAVLVYNRQHAHFEPDTVRQLVAAHPNVIGLKDGIGDMASLAAFRAALGDEFLLVNGMPCAELYAPVFRHAGVRAYSPSAIDFCPSLAWAYHNALLRDDQAVIHLLLNEFYMPYAEMRALVPGYGVALSKAARALRGVPVGGVRPPLVDPSPEHRAALARLLEKLPGLLREVGCSMC
ncbi:MAG: 5-dehydro-4-deoxyglucarate dehydratase [Chloroflexi bacterium]|nr:5-dehydro-4-deoxyglucarate dehydratase [Chloroflexota bacterium]